MAPISSADQGASSAAAASICFNTCNSLQVILGCVVPLVAVASTIPAIIIIISRRRLATKRSEASSGARRAQTKSTTPRTQATPRLPCTSVYIARVDYYLPNSNTAASRSVAESESKDSFPPLPPSRAEVHDDNIDDSPPLSSSPELPYLAPPLVSLPSLSSMLCEFTIYADAIEPEYLTEARRSSTCLLDSVSSSMDVKTLSLTVLPTISPAAPGKTVAPLTLPKDATVCPTVCCGELDSNNDGFNSASGTLQKEPPLFYGEEETVTEKDRGFVVPVPMEDVLRDNSFEEDVEEVSTSNLVPATTSWSIVLSSSSTLASILAVRLSQFPAVPTFPPLPPISLAAAAAAATSVISCHSESSLGSTFTCSASAPASLNILDIHLDSVIPHRRPRGPFLLDSDSLNPGELWDDEDDLLFSVCLPRTLVDLSRPVRHTWTAGFCNDVDAARSEIGELWDDDDDRRFSFAGEITMVEASVSSSMFGIELPEGEIARKPSLETIKSESPANQSCDNEEDADDDDDDDDEKVSGDVADRTLCISESDFDFNESLGFAEADESCFDYYCDVDADFGEAQKITYGPFVKDRALALKGGSWTPSTPSSSFCRFGFVEDLDVDVDASTPIYLSESSRSSSFMSFASVLDDTIRDQTNLVYDDDDDDDDDGFDDESEDSHAVAAAEKAEDVDVDVDVEKMFEVVVVVVVADDDDDDDMEVEPDMSYSSRIISVNYPHPPPPPSRDVRLLSSTVSHFYQNSDGL